MVSRILTSKYKKLREDVHLDPNASSEHDVLLESFPKEDRLDWIELNRNLHQNPHVVRANIGKEFARHTLRQIRRSKANFCLGFFACLIVVLVVSVLLTVLQKTPVVFLRLSELLGGETDLRLTPQEGADKLNFTLIQQILKDDSTFALSSPRYEGWTTIYPGSACNASNYCTGSRGSAWLVAMDSRLETQMGLGRDWSDPPLRPGEVYVSDIVATGAGVRVGDQILININCASLFGQFWSTAFSDAEDPSSTNQATNAGLFLCPIRVTVRGTFSSTAGKVPIRYSRVLFIEYDSLLPLIATEYERISVYLQNTYLKNLTYQAIDIFRKSNLYDYAPLIYINFPSALRLTMYLNTNYDNVQTSITHLANQLSYQLGFHKVRLNLPIVRLLRTFNFIGLFLGLVIDIIIFVLMLICVILIYSLLITNVETRTFEFGVLRMLGMKRIEAIILLLFQALSYSALSFPIGIIAGQGVAYYLANNLGSLIGLTISPLLTPTSVVAAAALGTLTPLLSSILPIRHALGQNLHDSLDTRQSKTKAVQISLTRSEDESFAWTTLFLGAFLSAFGLAIYYLMPYSLLSFNLDLLLYIFVALLMGMLLGLVILSLNLQSFLENTCANLLFFWDRKAITDIVKKNLTAHRPRNQKTAILFSVSLSFIVFISVSYSLQVSTFQYSQQQSNGCFLKVTSSDDIVSRNRLEQFAIQSQFVKSYGWISHPFTFLFPEATIQLTNLGHFYRAPVNIRAVSPNLFDATIQSYLKIDEFASDLPLLESLYSIEGTHSTIVGSVFKQELGLSLGSPFLLEIATGNLSQPIMHAFTPQAFLDLAPAFYFSKFPRSFNQDVLVSFSTFCRLTNGSISSVEFIPLNHFIINMQDGISNSEIDLLKQQLEKIIAGDAEIWDYRDSQGPITQATEILSYFFDFTTIVAMLVSFFSLNSSMYTNIYEQSKEIGILRALGISKFSLYRIYIYEAVVVVLSSSFSGAMIGIGVGYTMTIQRHLFTQLPIPFVVPTGILVTVSIAAIFFSIVASFGPIRTLLQKSVVNILRFVY